VQPITKAHRHHSDLLPLYRAVVLILLLSGVVSAQDSLEQLREAVKQNPRSALVLELGRMGTDADATLLRSVAANSNLPEESKQRIQWALGRLGDMPSFLNIVADCYENHGAMQSRGFEGLQYVGGPLSLRVLLDRLSDAYSAPREGDMLFWSPRDQALVVLSNLVPDPPVRFDLAARSIAMATGSNVRERAVGIWQEYFKHHADALRVPGAVNWAQILDQVIAQDDARAVLALGRLGDRSMYPLFKRRQADRNLGAGISMAIEWVLARLGDKESFARITQQTLNSDAAAQDDAIKGLAFVGGRGGVQALAGLLTATSPRVLKAVRDVDGRSVLEEKPIPPLSTVVKRALWHLIADFPVNGTLQEQQRAVQTWVRANE
jgi:hypothetical protein